MNSKKYKSLAAKSKLLLTLFLPYVASAASGNGAGNGGNALVCFKTLASVEKVQKAQKEICPNCLTTDIRMIPNDPTVLADIKSIEAYDLVKARKISLNRIVIGQNLTDEEKILETWLERSDLATEYVRTGVETGKDNLTPMTPSGAMVVAPDIKPVDVGYSNCVYTTVMKQTPFESKKNLLTYDERLYNHKKHKAISKAAFAFHERLLAYLTVRNVTFTNTESLTNLTSSLIANYRMRGSDVLDLIKMISPALEPHQASIPSLERSSWADFQDASRIYQNLLSTIKGNYIFGLVESMKRANFRECGDQNSPIEQYFRNAAPLHPSEYNGCRFDRSEITLQS